MKGLPEEALDELVALMARVCRDPWDPVHSTPAGEGRRVADLGEHGFIVFTVDEAAFIVQVFELVWTA
jgi:hypothetical protein